MDGRAEKVEEAVGGCEAAVGDLALRIRASRGCLGSGVPSRWDELSSDCMIDSRRRMILLLALVLIVEDGLEDETVVKWGAAVLCSSRLCCLVVACVAVGASIADKRGRRVADSTGEPVEDVVGEARIREPITEPDDEVAMSDLRDCGGEEETELVEDMAASTALGGVAEAEMESRIRSLDMLRLSEPERPGSELGLPVAVEDEEEVEKDDERISLAVTHSSSQSDSVKSGAALRHCLAKALLAVLSAVTACAWTSEQRMVIAE